MPAALARIRSSHSNLDQVAPLSEGRGTSFRAGPPHLDEDQSVDEILQKLSPEYRADVARMLIRSASKALPDIRQGYAPFGLRRGIIAWYACACALCPLLLVSQSLAPVMCFT